MKKTGFGKYGAFAIARSQAGNDIYAGALLYRLKYYFDPRNKINKLERFGLLWIAMSRLDWAREASLTDSEMKNRALPKLRKFDFVEIRQMCLTPKHKKMLWMHLDLAKLYEANVPPELMDLVLTGEKVPGSNIPTVNYPYKISAE